MIRFPWLLVGSVTKRELNAGMMKIETRTSNDYFHWTSFYGDGIDQNTGNVHGRILFPREGQTVGLLFEEGMMDAPYAVFPMPYSLTKEQQEKYTPEKLFEIESGGTYDDIIDSHYKGQRILKRADGKLEIQSMPVGGNRTKIVVDESGNVDILHLNGAEIKMAAAGDIELIPKAGRKVKIGAGAQGIARLNDTTTSTIAIDPTFWAWLNALHLWALGMGFVYPLGAPPSLGAQINSASAKGATD